MNCPPLVLDYDVATENMRVNLHMKADSLSAKVRTRKFGDDQGEGLIFQFFDLIGSIKLADLKARDAQFALAMLAARLSTRSVTLARMILIQAILPDPAKRESLWPYVAVSMLGPAVREQGRGKS